jgi:hypothetical protein
MAVYSVYRGPTTPRGRLVMEKAKRLVRVARGLYRSEAGDVRVARRSKWRGKPAHWLVTVDTWLACQVVTLEFGSLAQVRDWLGRAAEGRS